MSKRKTNSPKPSRAQKQSKPQRAVVYILGDTSLVLEYVSLCASHGYAVLFNWNDVPAELPVFQSTQIKKSTQIPGNASFALELTNIDLDRKRKNLELLDRALPPSVAIASSSVTVSATEQSSWIRHKIRLVGCSALPTLGHTRLIEVAPTVFSPVETVHVVQRFFRSIGKEIELVQDRIGMVLPRIICQIINEAAFALQEEISSPQDLDLALKLGADYPAGPIERADRIGLQQVCAVLSALERDLGEDRYRVAPLLRQMAISGTWWQQRQATSEERQLL
jgi:3-hydroxybutyryl-CoA dehydrogenase